MKRIFHKIRKHWRSGLSYGLGLSRSLAGPINVHIETTNICNFKCIYCPQSKPDEHFSIIGKGKMSFENFKIIIDKLMRVWTIEEVVLTRDGEPLIHPDLEKFVNYAADKGTKITIGSNGSYFSEDRVVHLIENGLTKVKGDFCVNKELYEKLRVGGRWENVHQGYKNILDYAIEHNKDFHLTIVDLNTYYSETPEESAQSIEEMKQLFPYSSKYLSINFALMHNSLNQSEVILSTSKSLTSSHYNLCHHPWVELVVDYKGNAVGCCRDLRSEYNLGNILECDNIEKDIWNGKNMRYLRKQLKNKSLENISICNKCDLPYGISYAGSSIFKKLFRFLNR